jgi:hypothetical protein
LLRDNYETPFYSPELAGSEFQLQQLEMILKLSVDDFKSHAQTLSSPDELSVYIARQLMRQVAPSLLWITMHDIDIAHAGAFSLYIDGIRRTDRLCATHVSPRRSGRRTSAQRQQRTRAVERARGYESQPPVVTAIGRGRYQKESGTDFDLGW